MAQSLSRVLLHIVFSTKYRQPWIHEAVQPELYAYLAGACRKIGGEAYRVGGTEDHIHIACLLPRTLSISKMMEEIKKSSSVWMKSHVDAFTWQIGYGAFSLGPSQLSTLISYIDHQKEHHRTRPFKGEFLDLLKRHGVDYNEQYLWD